MPTRLKREMQLEKVAPISGVIAQARRTRGSRSNRAAETPDPEAARHEAEAVTLTFDLADVKRVTLEMVAKGVVVNPPPPPPFTVKLELLRPPRMSRRGG